MVLKCLKVNGGLIALVDLTGCDLSRITDDNVSIHLVDYGLLVKINDIEVPIPETLFDYFLENRTITIYPFDTDNYVCDPVLSVIISKESLIEARGAYWFWKKTEVNKTVVN